MFSKLTSNHGDETKYGSTFNKMGRNENVEIMFTLVPSFPFIVES